VSHFPHVPVRISESSGGTAPVGTTSGADDCAAGLLRLSQNAIHLLGRTDVVRQLDARCSVPAESCPEPEHHPARLEEADLSIWLLSAAPTERLVEPASPRQIGDAQGHEAYALLHSMRIPRPADELASGTPTINATKPDAALPLGEPRLIDLARRDQRPDGRGR